MASTTMDERMLQELQQIQAEEQSTLRAITQGQDEELKKAQHAHNQRIIWDSLLQTRMKIQNVASVGSKLPKPSTYNAFCERNPEISASYDELAEQISDVTHTLLQLTSALVAQNPEVPKVEIPSALPRKRGRSSADEIWEVISQTTDTLKPYVEDSLEKWHRRTHASAQKNLKAFNQSIVQQIDAALADKERVIKRSRLKRSQYRILGEETQPGAAGDDYDDEIYDDVDFYQTLLKDMIDATAVDGADPIAMGQQWLALQKLKGKKIRKEVDRRASKSRKIRYNVHEKLVNFMPPIETDSMTLDVRDDLFSNLFGSTDDVVLLR